MEQQNVPLWEKEYLSLKEASLLCGIGVNRLRELTNNDFADCVLYVGNKRLVKRRLLIERLNGEACV